MLNISSLRFSFFKHIFLQGSKKSSNFAPDFKIRVIMKKLFVTLFLIGMAMVVYSQDYYWYRGNKIPLEKGCRKYIIYEDDKLNESDKSHITHSEDVFYDEIPNLKWGTTTAHAIIEDTAHVHYSTISYRKDGDYYDNMFVTHRFYVKLKNQEDSLRLQELAERYSAEIVHKAALVNEEGAFPAWYILRCKLDAPKNALELANLFYETTDLFSATEPEMINIFLPEFPKAIKTLCDEWNVLRRSPLYMGYPANEYYTQHYRLTSDTVINGQHYKKLYQENSYSGAMREGTNRDIYYVPANSTHEYLLYAFNAQVGDTLSNLWVEGYPQEAFMETYANGWTMIVREIQETTPRTYVLNYTVSVGSYPYYNKSIVWLEGVGYQAGPIGSDTPFDFEIFTPQLLCAYNNGEQVYVSEMGEQYGCEYNYNPDSTPTDTIPLFIKDGPGSSTVEPVDPNLIYATLSKDILSIYVLRDLEINMVLYKAPSANHAPALKRTIKATTFTDSISTILTESGTYTLELTNPAWDYTIVGTFEYQVPQAIENTPANTPSATKILKDGRLFLRYKGQMYNVQGQQVQ